MLVHMCYTFFMMKKLHQAFEEIERLPSLDQEQIGGLLLSHVEKLQALRTETDKGLASLDAGSGAPLDMTMFIRQQHEGR